MVILSAYAYVVGTRAECADFRHPCQFALNCDTPVGSTLAERAGIRVAPWRIEQARETATLLVRRFDRDGAHRWILPSRPRTILA